MIAVLGMDQSEDSLVSLYVAGLSGIGYGLRQIIDVQQKHGARVQRIVISGGAGQDDLVRQILADTSGVPIVTTKAEEPVLLGSAILASMAAANYPDLTTAMSKMTRADSVFTSNEEVNSLHQKRFGVFVKLQEIARSSDARNRGT